MNLGQKTQISTEDDSRDYLAECKELERRDPDLFKLLRNRVSLMYDNAFQESRNDPTRFPGSWDDYWIREIPRLYDLEKSR